MRRAIPNLAWVGVLAIGGLLSVAATPAHAQGFGGPTGGTNGGVPLGGFFGPGYVGLGSATGTYGRGYSGTISRHHVRRHPHRHHHHHSGNRFGYGYR